MILLSIALVSSVFADNATLISNLMNALYDVGIAGSTAEIDVNSYGKTAHQTATAAGKEDVLITDLRKLTGKLRSAENLIQIWTHSPEFDFSSFNDDPIDQSVGELSELFEAITDQFKHINQTVRVSLPNVSKSVLGFVSAFAPLYECADLTDWDTLDSMMIQMLSMSSVYGLDVSIPVTLPGNCSAYTWPGTGKGGLGAGQLSSSSSTIASLGSKNNADGTKISFLAGFLLFL